MSLRDIFRSLHLIGRASHDVHFPLGLIFPLNLNLSICPSAKNIYLKFPLASKAKPVAAPAAWLNTNRLCFNPVSPATRAVTARAAALVTHSHSWTVEGKGVRICLQGKDGSSQPPDQPESETMQFCCLSAQEKTLSGAVDSNPNLVLLCFFCVNSPLPLLKQIMGWKPSLKETGSAIS